jgi:hypothetical protein
MPGMAAAIQTWTGTGVVPLYGKKAIEQGINLAPNTVFTQGVLLGPITSSASEVQTVTIGGTPTGGTFTLTILNPFTGSTVTTSALAYNASAATVQAALTGPTGFGSGNVTVTGSAGGPYTLTFGSALANTPVAPPTGDISLLTGGTPTIAFARTTIGRSSGTYGVYASGHSDGSQVPRCILKFACATDAAGNIYQGNTAGASEWGLSRPECPAYFSGYFRLSDLVGLDSNALGLTPSRFQIISGALGVTPSVVELV